MKTDYERNIHRYIISGLIFLAFLVVMNFCGTAHGAVEMLRVDVSYPEWAEFLDPKDAKQSIDLWILPIYKEMYLEMNRIAGCTKADFMRQIRIANPKKFFIYAICVQFDNTRNTYLRR